MNEQTRKALIPELDRLHDQALKLRNELDHLIDRSDAGEDVEKSTRSAWSLVATLREASDALKREGAAYVQDSITGWYRDLHWDMHPTVEVAEEDVTDPVYESIIYRGNDEWHVVIVTKTHGRERIVFHSDTATWEQVYSASQVDA